MSNTNKDSVFDHICQQYEQKLFESIQTYPKWRDDFIIDKKDKVFGHLNIDNVNDINEHTVEHKINIPYSSKTRTIWLPDCKNYDKIEKHSKEISKLVTKDERTLTTDPSCYVTPKWYGFGSTVTFKIHGKINWAELNGLTNQNGKLVLPKTQV